MNEDKNNTPIYQGASTKFGVSKTLYDRMSPAQKTMLDLTANKSSTAIANGNRANNVTPQLIQTFYNDAVNDPTINQYYKDQLALGQRDLQMNLEYINAKDTFEKEQTQRQFEAQQIADNEAAAASGTAYSSYRNKVDQSRSLDQYGVTDLKNRKNKLDAFNMGNQFEQNYGTNATPNISIGGQSYNAFGNQLGTLERNKISDIQAQAKINRDNFNLSGGLPNTTTLPLAQQTK